MLSALTFSWNFNLHLSSLEFINSAYQSIQVHRFQRKKVLKLVFPFIPIFNPSYFSFQKSIYVLEKRMQNLHKIEWSNLTSIYWFDKIKKLLIILIFYISIYTCAIKIGFLHCSSEKFSISCLVSWYNEFNIHSLNHLELSDCLSLQLYSSSLRVVRRHTITILIHYEGKGSLSFVRGFLRNSR